MRSLSTRALAGIAAALLVVLIVAGAIGQHYRHRASVWHHAAAITGGDPLRGENSFIHYGCGSCHAVSGVPSATGAVGPPLDGVADRMIIAGKLANNPGNMQHWIRDPQSVTPGTAMPTLGVNATEARDITAFLYTRTK